MIIRITTCLLLALVCGDLTAREMYVSGMVYLEADGKPGRSAGEAGVPDVQLSNGETIVRTDTRGRYSLTVRPGQTVFVIKPAAYVFTSQVNGIPQFWRHYFPSGSPQSRFGGIRKTVGDLRRWDFALAGGKVGSTFTVPLFSDPQPKNLTDVRYYEQDIVKPSSTTGEFAKSPFGITLGDLVNDDLSLYPRLNAVTAKLGIPWFNLPGNHDTDADARTDGESLLSWRNTFGPDTYVVEEGNASFLLMDDVIYQPGQSPRYLGGLREDQFAFIENYLAALPKQRQLILAMHIPLFDEAPGVESYRHADRQRLFDLLRDFPNVLVLSGHSHAQRHWYHGAEEGWHGKQPLHEYNMGAACGSYWSGIADAAGIPDATMNDGTPNGFAGLKLDGSGKYSLAWHNARDAADTQIGLHAPQVLRRNAYPAWGVYANVYMGDDRTRVQYRVDDGEWKPMKQVLQPDPALLAQNVLDDQSGKLRGYDRSPEAVASPHLWRGALPTDLTAGEHRVEVEAVLADGDGKVLQAETRYRLQEAQVPAPLVPAEALPGR